jgi:Ca2+-binding EF-hand superfamily protein|tara:strand:+ start:318 stop:776 length:459 start_codon:yes stop_codon:yes gene_type:complete
MLRFLPFLSVFATLTVLSTPPAVASTAWSIDRDRDGFVTRQEFYDYLALRHSARDRSKDGFIELYELTGRFVGGDTPFTRTQARAFMASFDLDRNKKVSSREMIAVIEYTGAFDQYDTNDDGRISATEGRALPFLNPPPKRVPTMPGYTPIE